MTDYRMDQTLTLGPVTLTVADLERSVRYYTQVAGFHLLDRQPQRAQLGVEGQVLVDLHEVVGAIAPPRSSPGLSHFAPLVPTRADVARFTQRHLDAGFDVDPRDHVVSQSCYVTDPDGHTIEVTWACITGAMAVDRRGPARRGLHTDRCAGPSRRARREHARTPAGRDADGARPTQGDRRRPHPHHAGLENAHSS
ncbi:VOC family protein [Streptomyces sp. NPDC056464]|uniref:VOC family protein n=1 Tax=Streptomyces sp. NPDC056464 TaxID=3345828 RepID=UPI0036B133FD